MPPYQQCNHQPPIAMNMDLEVRLPYPICHVSYIPTLFLFIPFSPDSRCHLLSQVLSSIIRLAALMAMPRQGGYTDKLDALTWMHVGRCSSHFYS